MTEQTSTAPVQNADLRSDLIGAAIATVIFAIALLMTFEWSDKAAMFPRIITGSGLFFSVLYGAGLMLKWHRAKQPGYVERSRQSVEERVHGQVQEQGQDDEPEPESEEVEYIFATAGRKAWLQALGWVAIFLVLIVLLGLFVASAIFALAYLRWGGRRTWLFSIVYAVILPVFLVFLFRVVLFVSTPIGILTGL